MKQLKIDWDELENAFTNRNLELVYYLDLVTGHVLLEGEEGDLADEDDYSQAVAPAPRRNDKTRAYIDLPDVATRLKWINAFVEEETDLSADFLSELREAIDSDDPAPSILQVLLRYAEERDRWYVYRSDRVHEFMEKWLEGHSIKTTDPAPW
jgi:hypothetical protein